MFHPSTSKIKVTKKIVDLLGSTENNFCETGPGKLGDYWLIPGPTNMGPGPEQRKATPIMLRLLLLLRRFHISTEQPSYTYYVATIVAARMILHIKWATNKQYSQCTCVSGTWPRTGPSYTDYVATIVVARRIPHINKANIKHVVSKPLRYSFTISNTTKKTIFATCKKNYHKTNEWQGDMVEMEFLSFNKMLEL